VRPHENKGLSPAYAEQGEEEKPAEKTREKGKKNKGPLFLHLLKATSFEKLKLLTLQLHPSN